MSKPYAEHEFTMGEIFDIHPTARKFNANEVKFGGNYPYVARGSSNNGIRGYITEEPRYLNPAHTLSFGQDTATVYYQEKAYFTGDKIKVMELRSHELTENIALYLIPVIRKAFTNFSWGQSSFNENVLNNIKIVLPVTAEGTPDWDYMQERIAELEQERIAELEQERIAELDAYLKVTGFDDCELTDEEKKILANEKKINYSEFTLESLFTSQTGDVDLQQKDVNGKGAYFINSGVKNRGIKGKTDREARLFPANTITIDFLGNAYYRDFEYKMATHNHVFSLSGSVIKNESVGLYLVGRLVKLSQLYSFDNMATWNILKQHTIELPVTKDGEIDFTFMEKYIRATEKLVIAETVKWKDAVIAATKSAVS